MWTSLYLAGSVGTYIAVMDIWRRDGEDRMVAARILAVGAAVIWPWIMVSNLIHATIMWQAHRA